MTKTINFTVPGVPVAKGRARSFIRAGHVAHYTPEQTARYENLVKMAARQAMGSWEPMQGAVEMVLLLHMPVPASWSQKRRTAALSGQVRPTTKPDCSNVLKAVEDGWVKPGSTVVCTVTGHGLKDPDTALRDVPEVTPLPVDPAAVVAALGLG